MSSNQAQPQADLSLQEVIDAAAKPGRRKRGPVPFSVKGELTREDLEDPSAVVPVPTIKSLRHSHHQIARCIAQKMRPGEISEITGYTNARISQLNADPQFKELVLYYEELEQEHYTKTRADFHERLAVIGFDSMEVLHERIVENPDNLTNKELLAIYEASLDRIGYGKTQNVNTQNVNLTLNADELARIRAEAQAGQNPALAEEDRKALLCYVVRETGPHSQAEAAEGSEGEGSGVRAEGGEGDQSNGAGPA